jgi:hypothetical protein
MLRAGLWTAGGGQEPKRLWKKAALGGDREPKDMPQGLNRLRRKALFRRKISPELPSGAEAPMILLALRGG